MKRTHLRLAAPAALAAAFFIALGAMASAQDVPCVGLGCVPATAIAEDPVCPQGCVPAPIEPVMGGDEAEHPIVVGPAERDVHGVVCEQLFPLAIAPAAVPDGFVAVRVHVPDGIIGLIDLYTPLPAVVRDMTPILGTKTDANRDTTEWGRIIAVTNGLRAGGDTVRIGVCNTPEGELIARAVNFGDDGEATIVVPALEPGADGERWLISSPTHEEMRRAVWDGGLDIRF